MRPRALCGRLAATPSIIKLDMSLVQAIDRERAGRALAAALISFAAEMGQDVVAEGVETERSVEVLRDLNVGYAQGYHFGRPQALDGLLGTAAQPTSPDKRSR